MSMAAALGTYYLCAFVNSHVPATTDVIGDYIEPSGSWYARISLNAWGAAYVNAANQGEIDETFRTWTASGSLVSESIYGYFVVDGSGNLVWAEVDPSGPQPMSVLGQTFTVQPTMREGALA